VTLPAPIERIVAANVDLYRVDTRKSGGEVLEGDGVCLIRGVHHSWVIANNAFRLDPLAPPKDVIQRVDRGFRELGRVPVLTTFDPADGDLEAALAEAGWHRVVELPIMVRAEPLDPGPDRDDVRIGWYDHPDPEALDAIIDILRRGFADDETEREMVGMTFGAPAIYAPPDAAGLVLELDRRPAAMGAVLRVDGGGTVVGPIATVAEARNRGLGRLATALVTNRGFEMGATWSTLQASPMGYPLYRKMGWDTVGASRVWLAPDAFDDRERAAGDGAAAT
jgi:hypothetical protein